MAKLLWTQKQDIGPRPRLGHAMAYDSTRQRIVLFGGRLVGTRFGDTWEWDGANWTQVQDINDHRPVGTVRHFTSGYDASNHAVVGHFRGRTPRTVVFAPRCRRAAFCPIAQATEMEPITPSARM